MKFIAQRLGLAARLFLACSILLMPAYCYVAQRYMANNFRKLGLSLLDWDACYFPIVLGVMFELAATGFVLLVIAALIEAVDHLRFKISN